MIDEKCPICNSKLYTLSPSTLDDKATFYNCPFCKKLHIDISCLSNLSTREKLSLKSTFAKLDTNSELRNTVINKNNINEISSLTNVPQSLLNKINNILSAFVLDTNYYGEQKEYDCERFCHINFCIDKKELNNILASLVKNGYITVIGRAEYDEKIKVVVNEKGLRYYEDNLISLNKSNQCFVAMWFNSDENIDDFQYNMQKVYNDAIKPAIENSKRKDNLNSIKIDDIDHNEDIVNRIIAEIRNSKFLVVDLTGYRGGVYYEAGYAEGLGLQVIYTCNKEWLMGNKEKNIPGVHFDTNHKNIIEWEYNKLEDFKNKLINRINATII